MKRSTLTLSILTALLVSACGGSSSNDEQTKDPTPPKVTPTNPSTPSTGKTTPTTGNKDNAGSSGGSAGSSSSSSSSDPTPPISSGSAPSGGKPIVITPTHPEQKPDPDEDEPTDPDEPAAGSLAAAQEAFEKAEQDWIKATNELKGAKSARITLQKDLDKHLKKAATTVGIEMSTYPDARLESIKAKIASLTDPSDASKKETAEKALKDYETMKKSWETAKETEKAAQKALEKAKETKFTAKRDLALEEVKAGLAKSDDVKSAKNYFAAKEKQAKAKFEVNKAQLKLDQFTAQKAQLENDKKVLEAEQKDLTAAITIAASDAALKTKLEKQKANVDAQIIELGKRIEGIKEDQKLARAEKKRHEADLPTNVDDLKEIAGNRGVAGGSDLSSKNFVEIQVAEFNEADKKWTLTFKDDTKAEIDMKDHDKTSGTLSKKVKKTSSGNDVVYAYFGKVDDKITAFNPSKASGNASIYGYIGDKFYSVGKVAEADVVNKIKDGAVVYNGKALLNASGKGLVSTFTGTANFNDNTFTGSFKEFASYDRTKTDADATVVAVPDDLKGKLPETVDFESNISDNKFEAKIVPNKANVYGFFYGEKADEVGGLVKFNDVFHGSFGGATKQE